MQILPRESVIFAEDYDTMVAWYRDVLNLNVKSEASDDYHYTHFINDHGINLGIASASEMGINATEKDSNSVRIQFAVEDVKAFFMHIESHGGSVSLGPSFDKKGQFWFGGFNDPEGNPFWVVDKNCP